MLLDSIDSETDRKGLAEAVPVLFLPGFMCDERLFSSQIDELGSAGYPCLFDQLDHAKSVPHLACNILNSAPPRFALVGLSMGGIVALEVYRQASERVTHLALLNTTAHADTKHTQRIEQMQRVSEGAIDFILREELKPTYLAPENRTTLLLKLVEEMGKGLGPEVFLSQSTALMQRRCNFHLLPQIKVPTLILVGANDGVCPPVLHREMSALIPGARYIEVARCGHLSAIEQPDEVSRALKELLGLPTSDGQFVNNIPEENC
jgi:pimeloyl-ACP methyl ester carboxylesterase